MTHLKIELSNSSVEQVAPLVIEKLYDIVHSGNLDASSNLIGNLNTTATYENYIDYLEELFTKNGVRLLVITAAKKYLMFEDPAVLSVLATAYGDGTGVTQSELESVNEILLLFKGNTNITSFNEFKYFTGINHPNVNWQADWFTGCTNLREVTIPKNVVDMRSNNGCFTNCTSLLTVTFDPVSSVEKLSGFLKCTSLVNISIPDSVQTIEGDCFRECSSLLTIDTKNATKLGGNAFKLCSSLTSATILNVEEIQNECFYADSNLTSINYSSTITTLRRDAFAECSNLVINDLSLPNLTTLESGVFSGCGKLKQVSNLGLLTSLPGYTFNNCSQLTSVTLPLTVTSIGEHAFYGCSALTGIDLSNITTIGNAAFKGCSSLLSINSNLSNVTSVGSEAFTGCSSLQGSISIPNATVGTYAFNGTGLTEISIPNYTITEYSFNSSPNLKKLTVGNPTTINTNFVYNCPNLEEIVFTGGTSVQYNSTTGYVDVTLSSITRAISSSFRDTPKLFKEMEIGNTTYPVNLILSNCTRIDWAAFNHSGMTKLTLPAITTIENDTFAGNTNLRYVDLTGSTIIGVDLFGNCTNLTTVVLSNTLTTIKNDAFKNCSSLTSFTIPSSVTELGAAVFSGSGILYLIFLGSTPPSTLGGWGWPNVPVYVPNDAVSAYLTAFAAATNDAIKNNIHPISDYNPS